MVRQPKDNQKRPDNLDIPSIDNALIGGIASYDGYESINNYYKSKDFQNSLPDNVGLKITTSKGKKYIQLQFTIDGKQTSKGCSELFTITGLINARDKALLVSGKLNNCDSLTEFESWYSETILQKTKLVDDRITYCEIFKQIEDSYYQGKHFHTQKTQRTKDNPSFVNSFTNNYRNYFNRFTKVGIDLDKQPTYQTMMQVLSTYTKGTCSYKKCLDILKKIASYCGDKTRLLSQLDNIDGKQTEFKEYKQVDLEEFLQWFNKCKLEIPNINNFKNARRARKQWLWVTAMCVVYGLRGSEIKSALNLPQPYYHPTLKKPILAINDPSNTTFTLVIDDVDNIGCTTKTGKRFCIPMCLDKDMIKHLGIQDVDLPTYTPRENTKLENIADGFINLFRGNLGNWNCPIGKQTHAFRNLANLLGIMYGIPDNIRAKSLGHSVMVNEKNYQKRASEQMKLDILNNATNRAKHSVTLEVAKKRLENAGKLDKTSIDLLKIIFENDDII